MIDKHPSSTNWRRVQTNLVLPQLPLTLSLFSNTAKAAVQAMFSSQVRLGPSILVLTHDWPGVCTLDHSCYFHAFLAQIHIHTILDYYMWNLSINFLILTLVPLDA